MTATPSHRRPPRVGTRLQWSIAWLAILPIAAWSVHAFYLPVLAPSLATNERWLATAVIVLAIPVSAFAHVAGHLLVARMTGMRVPKDLPVLPTGDASQSWSVSPGGRGGILVPLAGPLASGAVALVAYLAWLPGAGAFIETVALFLFFLNLSLAVLNLAPCFPFDGANLVRGMVLRRGGSSRIATRFCVALSAVLLFFLAAWAVFLYQADRRFSTETSAITAAAALVVAAELALTWRKRDSGQPEWTSAPPRLSPLRWIPVLAVTLVLFLPSLALLPTNQGLEAPGPAKSLDSMVQVPDEYSHRLRGSLIFTTVVPQAPIVAAEWLYAHLDHSIKLTSAETIVPRGTTPQRQAVEGLRDLQLSEKTAAVMGLKLAGFPASLTFSGAVVTSVDSSAAAAALLQPGDQFTRLEGQPVGSTADVTRVINTLPPNATTIHAGIKRKGQDLELDLPLSTAPGGRRRLGVALSPTGEKLDLPFPVSIRPKGIEGGPSAGLMFTLAVANALNKDDITRGHRIAGTGTIDLQGNVGAIGGVQQKVAAAEGAKAEYFLVPPDNYADAVAAAKHIKVIRVATANEALDFLKTLPSR